ncbi:MAG: PD-(D/E)XK nuclease family protein [Prevotella sp.]|jgi:hypothetical protein|nr:PD-(D/E)XK nuclease family protein [Prevotella sp.]MCI1281853.1 PD-(D/E)XK nuclease family protein [Prevotella sp.]
MKIYFSPLFTQNAYYDFKGQRISFDAKICGIGDLFQLFGLHLGIHYDMLSSVEREAEYYNVFRAYMSARPENIFYQSFQTGGMEVASCCLRWRDSLRLAGWKPEKPQPSERLTTLAEVEKSFDCPGEADYIIEVLRAMEKECPLPSGSKIVIYGIERKMLPPYVEKALVLLEKSNIIVSKEIPSVVSTGNLGKIQNYLINNKIEALDSGDDSFRIINFADDMTAMQYVASLDPKSADVYINSDNKKFDDLQSSLDYPTSGSSIANADPQIAQMFKIGLTLFGYPLNIINMLSWLVMPVSPIPSALRYSLARVIADEGGIYNEKWKKALKNYKEKDRYENEDRAKREKNVEALEILLPHPDSDDVNQKSLVAFVSAMQSWCVMRSKMADISDLELQQYGRLLSMYSALLTVMKGDGSESFKYEELEKWMNAIYDSATYKYTDATRNSRFVISSPSDMASNANAVTWMDFYNYSISPSTYDFLNPEEKKALADCGCQLWDEESETRLYNYILLIPILRCNKKFTAITVDKRGTDKPVKHPLHIRLESTFQKLGFSAVCKEGQLPDSLLHDAALIDNGPMGTSVKIKNASFIVFPDHESNTSLNSLIQYPFDYVMEYLAGIRNGTSYQIGEQYVTLGNVAHKMIQTLCQDNDYDLDKIRLAFNQDFDSLLNRIETAKGAILLLKQNKTDEMLFRQRLHESISALLDIISDNHLTISSCERPICQKMGFSPNIDIKGFLDMTLKDKDGKPVIFDFKWSGLDNYTSKLTDNRAMQLSLYAALLSAEDGKPVSAKGYYILPVHKLLTTDDHLIGTNVRFISPEDVSELVPKLINSYRYRRDQISRGDIEMADGNPMDPELIPYLAAMEGQNLYPLESYQGNKNSNRYSNYNLFKGQKK